MEQVIYIDVLVAINFIVNLLLLNITQKLTGVVTKQWQRFVGAGVGSVCSFAIFLPLQNFMVDVLMRVVITALVIVTTFYQQTFKQKLKLTVVFFCAGFVFAGIVVAVWFMLPSSILSLSNGAYYANISPLVLVVTITVAYLFVTLFSKIFNMGIPKSCSYQVAVLRNGKIACINAFLDTGNHLCESFSGLPVMVVSFNQIASLLTMPEVETVTQNNEQTATLRPIFYNGAGGSGILYGFKADEITFTQQGQSTKTVGYVAVATWEIDCQGCTAIFGKQMLSLQQNQTV